MTDEQRDPLAHACELVGRFFYHFSRMEEQLNAAIARLFKLEGRYAQTVTALMNINAKIDAIAMALSQGKFSVNTEALIDDIRGMNHPVRTTVAHYVFEPEEDGVRFTRVTATRGKFKEEQPHLSKADFEDHYKELERLTGELKQIVTELKPDEVTWPIGAGWAEPSRAARFAVAQMSDFMLGSSEALLASQKDKGRRKR